MGWRSTVFLALPAAVLVWASFRGQPELDPPPPSTSPVTWSLAALEGLAALPGGRVGAVAFDANGRGLAGSNSGQDFTTGDAGREWSARPGPAGATTNIALGEGGLVLVSVGNGRVFRSLDDGDSWVATRPQGRPIYDVLILGGDTVLAVGDRILSVSADGGETWSDREIPVAGQVWYDADFPSSRAGYVVGGIGQLLRTTDGADTWTRSPPISEALLRGVATPDDRSAVVVGSGGTIVRTGDAGATWVPVASGTPQHLTAVAFLDAEHGVAVGLYGTVVTTADGGRTWELENAGTDAHLYDVAFAPDGAAVAVGWLGTIVRKHFGEPLQERAP